jgi:serine O-acetyltransferase
MVRKSILKDGIYSPGRLPSKAGIARFTGDLTITLFPVIGGGGCHPFSERKLRKQLLNLLKPIEKRLSRSPGSIVDEFINSLPELKIGLERDAAFIALNDPAATGIDEVVMTYPGFYAILIYRIAHSLASAGVPLIPRVMTEYAHSQTGIDIHPGATIGPEFCIDHGTGIVIGETSVIGAKVKLYQGVTIGALSVKKELASVKRHPTIEDNVIIYAGSTILGGDTIIGHDSIIGGNVWLTESVPPYSVVFHHPQITVKDRNGK